MDMNYRGGTVGGSGCAGWSVVKEGEWDNCNSIINKVYLKRDKYHMISPVIGTYNQQNKEASKI